MSSERANSAVKIAGAAPGHHLEPHAGRLLADPLVASSGSNSSTTMSGIIRRKRRWLRAASKSPAEQAAHLIERLRQRCPQRLRAGRQFHARADAHQQRIVEHVAQSLQRMACRRLRQADAHRRAADVGFDQQRIERHQQIEVERGSNSWGEYISYEASIGRISMIATDCGYRKQRATA